MFKYINMPKLVAHYLREFSVNVDGEPSILYKFIWCLCLPFIAPQTFRRVRLLAYAIAECTNSADQITRILEAYFGVTVNIIPFEIEYFTAYDGSNDSADFPYNNSTGQDNPLVPYMSLANAGNIEITLNGASEDEVRAILELLIPFYIQANYIFL